MHVILDHHEITEDLTERCLRLARQSYAIFGSLGGVTPASARLVAEQLHGQLKETGGNRIAQLVLTHLVPELERRGTTFWGTPLGRACGWWTGGGQLEVNDAIDGTEAITPQPRVSLLLGITRQSAFELVTKGRMKKVSAVGVRPEDVRREMQARYPL